MLLVSMFANLQILELLWRLAHLPQLSREMVELALDSHSSILIDSYHTKDAEKKTYIAKCVEDIKKVHSCHDPICIWHRVMKDAACGLVQGH